MNWSAEDVVELLRRRHSDPFRWVVLEEVVLGQSRADVVVWSCYPSDGLGLTVYEVKVSRRDWLQEIRSPWKNAPWRSVAARFVYVAPAGIIHPGEVPKDRGWMVAYSTKGGHLRMKQKPPKAVQGALHAGVVTTLLRNAARPIGLATGELYQRTTKMHDDDLAAIANGLRSVAPAERVVAGALSTIEDQRARLACKPPWPECRIAGGPRGGVRPMRGRRRRLHPNDRRKREMSEHTPLRRFLGAVPSLLAGRYQPPGPGFTHDLPEREELVAPRSRASTRPKAAARIRYVGDDESRAAVAELTALGQEVG